MKVLNNLLLLLLSILCGCSNRKIVVTDVEGSPLQGVEIYAQSESINCKPTVTNENGEAKVPQNIQGVKWILIRSKEGQEILIDAPSQWPAVITLGDK